MQNNCKVVVLYSTVLYCAVLYYKVVVLTQTIAPSRR